MKAKEAKDAKGVKEVDVKKRGGERERREEETRV